MPPEGSRLVRRLTLLSAPIVPLLAGYLVYFQWRTPALDSTLPLAQAQLPYLLSAIIVALIFSGLGTFVVWRRPLQVEARLFFCMVQPIAVGLLFFLAFPNLAARPYWMEVVSIVGFHLSGAILVHYYLTFPVVLGTPRQRRWVLAPAYLLMLVALAFRLSGADLGLRLSFLYNTAEIVGAIVILVYAYVRRASADGRRRLRVVVFGAFFSATPPFFLYLLPKIAGLPDRMPDWMVGPFMVISPLSYVLAIVRHKLFDIDRVLNRAAVYAVMAAGILLLYLIPFLLIYRYLPGDWLGQISVAAGLTLLVGVGFDWTRARVQRGVDRFFYGGWYDYPGVVETISGALARSIERAELSDVLTRQVPTLMQLETGRLVIGDTSPSPSRPQLPSAMPLPLAFQGQTRAVWIVGGRRDGEDFTADDRRILNTLARQAEVSLSNVLLVEMLRQQLAEIRASRETLAGAQRQLLSSREDERARLARDLHDGPIQELVGLNMQLGLLLSNGSSPLSDVLEAMRLQVRALLSDLRHVCAELRPPMLDTLGLGAALRVLADDWSKQTGIPVQMVLPPDATLRALAGQAPVNLYRLAQEALTNIARHAAARRVAICLEWQDTRLAMTIHDDGRGFVVPTTLHGLAAQGHFGLVGMQERATLIGASLTVQSSPGHGTTLQIVL